MEEKQKLNRLRWRCTRRAMLEMDLLLGEFLDRIFPTLTPAQAERLSPWPTWKISSCGRW
jgi:succinate dehydrogenase flavin-adding protein (antitoxin of CptAB toxin-antitoxin module)